MFHKVVKQRRQGAMGFLTSVNNKFTKESSSEKKFEIG